MEIVTIACPTNLEHPGVDKTTAPIWIDTLGNEYTVASGIIPDTQQTEWTEAKPDQITVIVGMDAFSALSLMGLKEKATADE